jgi:hypothetical protein
MIFTALLMLAAAAPTTPVISSERTAENRYLLTVEAAGISTVEQGQALLLPTARTLCGDLPATFDSFRWVSSDRIATATSPAKPVSLRLEQDLICGEPPAPAINSAAPVGSDWKPAAGDREKVVALSYAYFAAKDEGRYAPAYEYLAERLRQMSPFEQWQASERAFREKAGRVGARHVVEVSWYVNPPDTAPGLYAAADFKADFAKVEVCGYVVWLLRRDGTWRLVREEQNILDRESMRDASAAQLARIHDEMGCKG